MPENAIQFHSQDGCTYVFDIAKHTWYKFCLTDTLPLDVRRQIQDLREKADALSETDVNKGDVNVTIRK
jgi:hypothetical protein